MVLSYRECGNDISTDCGLIQDRTIPKELNGFGT